ncbi:MAG: prephenate dehydratase [Rhodothermaceae bacterium]
MHSNELAGLREKINQLDSQLIDLLARRREASNEVIKTKNKDGLPIRDLNREEEILKNLIIEGKKKGLDAFFVTNIFNEIIEDSVRLQQKFVLTDAVDNSKSQPLKIAIQGIIGSYSSLAARKFFSRDFDNFIFSGKNTFEEVVRTVEKGGADYAMLPVENTTSGSINEVYDALMHTSLSIIGEEIFQVKHCLVANEKIALSKIKRIYAHPQAAAQCSVFLRSIPDVQIEFFTDTAMSARKIKEEGDNESAAIASLEAAQTYGVEVIKENIANQESNFTRFLIASRKPVSVDSRVPCKTSIVMAINQTPGSLLEALGILGSLGINMTKLESRPVIGNPWEELFYLDIEGNIEDEKIKDALEQLGNKARYFKVLGSYP